MNKRRIVAVLATVAVVATILAGCTKKPETTTPSTQTPAKKYMVGLSTDEGGLNDKSFNQAADTGLKKAVTEFGITYKPIESTKKEDYEANLDALIAAKSDLVFGVGFQMEGAMRNIAKKYPDKKFAIIDSTVVENPDDPNSPQMKNVESLCFKENEGSFLVGVIAGKVTKANKIGFIGGKDFALINKFEAGFAAGVKAVNPTAAEDLISRKEVKYADSFGDVNKGYELAKALINDGCDVIYHAAGGVGIGMFKAVKEATDAGKKVWAIGVDMDQAATVPEYANYILTSMMKRVDTATYLAAKDLTSNAFKGGQIISFGLKEDGVGIAPSSNKNTPADVLALVAKYSDAVKAGKIAVPEKPADVKTFTAPEVK